MPFSEMEQNRGDRRLREKNKKFCLGYVDFEVPISHPSGSS